MFLKRCASVDGYRFLTDPFIPFTNNPAEQSLQMEKVKQKISGCYRSMDLAKNFALIRSYLLSCGKNGVSASEALKLLFDDQWPELMHEGLKELGLFNEGAINTM